MQIQMTLKNRVREARQNRRMTQEQLAQAASVTRQTIIAIEKGRLNPSVHLSLDLARVLQQDVGDLFYLSAPGFVSDAPIYQDETPVYQNNDMVHDYQPEPVL